MMLYRLIMPLARLYMRLGCGLRVSGAGAVPKSGPLIVSANHMRWLDCVAIACATTRPVHFMSKAELFRLRPLAWLLRQLGAYPVRRGQIDRGALRESIELTAKGEVLGIFPEGTRTRSGKLRPPQSGAAVIAFKTGAPIVPAGIRGYGRGEPLLVAWGEPLFVSEFGGRADHPEREAVRALSGALIRRIAALCGREPPDEDLAGPHERTVPEAAEEEGR